MIRLYFILILVFLMPSISIQAKVVFCNEVSLQFNKNAMIQQKLKKAQECLDNGQFASAQALLNGVLKLNPDNVRAKSLLAYCNEEVQKQKKKEQQAYDDACRVGTALALQSFISKYPKSDNVNKANIRLKDYELWNNAKNKNTIDAYNKYLSESSLKAYKEEASTAIKKLEEDKAWTVCKDSNSETLLSDFILKYPSSCHINEAQYLLNIIRGEENYAKRFFYTAYSYLDKANNYRTLTGVTGQHYREIKQKHELNKMIASSDVSEVVGYYKSLPSNSPHRKEIANRIAILKASQLSFFSDDCDIQEALSYATDAATRNIVQNYIDKAAASRRRYKRIRRAEARKEWWRDRFNIGWNICHLDCSSDFDTLYDVGTGLKVRLGRWNDAVNFIFGAEYNYCALFYDEADYTENLHANMVEIPVGIRFNLFEIYENIKLYVGCEANCGFKLSSSESLLAKRNFSIVPQIGIISKHWDLGLYYKTYLKSMPLFANYPSYKSQKIGCFLTYYF